jgi:hypothetical protein
MKLTSDTQWRVERLAQVKAAVPELHSAIEELADYEDSLIIYWRRDWTIPEERAIDGVWRTLGCTVVVHAMGDRGVTQQ